MATIEKQFYVSGNAVTENKGTTAPAWAGHEADKTKWDSSTNEHVDWFYHLVSNTAYMQYGQNKQLWAGCRHLQYMLSIKNEVINADNSITVTLEGNLQHYAIHNTDFVKAGVAVVVTVTGGGGVIINRTGKTDDEYILAPSQNNPFTLTVTVPPQGTSTESALKIKNVYPNHEFTDNEITIGFALHNPLEDTYVAGGYVEPTNRQWRACNKHAKRNQRKVSAGWANVAKELNSTEGDKDTGHERVKKADNSGWYQARNEDSHLG